MAELTNGIVKNLENISKLKYVMSLNDNIKDIFDVIERCRPNIANQEIRDIEKKSLLFAEEILKTRRRVISEQYFSDIRESCSMHEKTCMNLIKLYREEIALYE
jgi:hypothetical protein